VENFSQKKYLQKKIKNIFSKLFFLKVRFYFFACVILFRLKKIAARNFLAAIFLFPHLPAYCGERIQYSNTIAYVSGAVHRTVRERAYSIYELLKNTKTTLRWFL
jgi:hypothetical protein